MFADLNVKRKIIKLIRAQSHTGQMYVLQGVVRTTQMYVTCVLTQFALHTSHPQSQ